MHKFNGLDEEKNIKALPERDRAEKHAYRNSEGFLYIPCDWIRGSIINSFVSRAGSKEKTKKKLEVSPRITVTPSEMSINQTQYTIDKRGVPSGPLRGAVRDMCIRPLIEQWETTGQIVTTLGTDTKDMKTMLEIAGEDVGIGSNRVNGYGRFTVNSFKLVT